MNEKTEPDFNPVIEFEGEPLPGELPDPEPIIERFHGEVQKTDKSVAFKRSNDHINKKEKTDEEIEKLQESEKKLDNKI